MRPGVGRLLAAVLVSTCGTTSRGAQDTEPRAEALRGECRYEPAAVDGAGIVLAGTLIIDGRAVEGQAIHAADGVIQAVGERDAILARHPDAAHIVCSHAYISPGFINAHEHISRSYAFPHANVEPTYTHRNEWQLGLNNRRILSDPPARDDAAVLAWVEIRHLLAGETTVAASGAVPGFVRNVTRDAPPLLADLVTFPFGAHAMESFGAYHCASPGEWPEPSLTPGVPITSPYVAHVGEGVNCEARLEIDAFLAYAAAHPSRKYTMIHALALTDEQVGRMRESNVSLVWSPRSNLALYGRTLDAAHVLDNGISVALGSDWSVSGSYNLIGEIRCAAMAAAAFGERPLSGEEVWRMVTSAPAAALGLSNATGAIVQGYAADFVIIDDSDGTNIAALATLTEAGVIAVVVEGRLAAGNRDALSGELAPACMRFANRFVCPYPNAPVDVPEMRRVNRGHVDVISLTRETPCLAPAPAD